MTRVLKTSQEVPSRMSTYIDHRTAPQMLTIPLHAGSFIPTLFSKVAAAHGRQRELR